jgi:hypothetical protein
VRLRYTGWKRAKANHASSQRNTRSGLIASNDQNLWMRLGEVA